MGAKKTFTQVGQIRVLIIEDNDVDRELLKAHLQAIGLSEIQEAKNGTEALFKKDNAEMIGSPFHILITDWKMPQKDGMSLLQSVRKDRSKPQPHIIMITGVSEDVKVMRAINNGVDDFVLKPVDPLVLRQKIMAIIEKIEL